MQFDRVFWIGLSVEIIGVGIFVLWDHPPDIVPGAVVLLGLLLLLYGLFPGALSWLLSTRIRISHTYDQRELTEEIVVPVSSPNPQESGPNLELTAEMNNPQGIGTIRVRNLGRRSKFRAQVEAIYHYGALLNGGPETPFDAYWQNAVAGEPLWELSRGEMGVIRLFSLTERPKAPIKVNGIVPPRLPSRTNRRAGPRLNVMFVRSDGNGVGADISGDGVEIVIHMRFFSVDSDESVAQRFVLRLTDDYSDRFELAS